jgi:hypothetical protein
MLQNGGVRTQLGDWRGLPELRDNQEGVSTFPLLVTSPPIWSQINSICKRKNMIMIPELQLGILNGWIPLVLYFIGLIVSVSFYSEESRLWLFNNPKD